MVEPGGDKDDVSNHTEGAETARRALRLVEAVVAAGEPVGLPDLVAQVGLSKSTCYRLLRVLQEERYVDRIDSGGYFAGSRLVGVAAAVLPQAALHQAAAPALRALADTTGETATLHVRSGGRAVLVLGAESTAEVLRRAATIGETTRLGRGASGRAILAALPVRDADRLAGQADDAEELRAALAKARTDGYVLSFGEDHPGVHGIAAPVPSTFDGDGGMSVAVSGPAERWTEARMRASVPWLLETCAELGILFAKEA
ncbi:IclR family transcriptional regulator [Amycolatopsis sp. NPDC088138]|uniref:IclR family transcriptional regulator n=1 Tax=Amycolatopsis sp. NPDC088138 TaxID=3363938 RepID=UPI00381EA495